MRSHVVRSHQQLAHLIDILPLLKCFKPLVRQELPPPIIPGDNTELPEGHSVKNWSFDIMANSPKAFPSP